MYRLIVTICLTLLFLTAPGVDAAEAVSPGAKAVLVTGASTGIGRKITEKLSADGYFIYATARKEDDLKALAGLKNVQPIKLDVTSEQDIAAAVETVKKGGRGLYGLVNNAGVGTLGSLVDQKPEEFDLTMKVNVYGPFRVSRAFAPFIVEQKGRLVTIGSISGILSGPNLSAYAMSKHAVEAFTDSIAAEMQPLGVHVSVVEPGNYNSNIAKNAVARMGADPKLGDRSRFKEPDDVAAAVSHALFDTNPKRRYLVVPVEDEAKRTVAKVIAQLVELNEGHAYTFDRDTLVKMLDEALAKSRPRTK